MQIKIYGMLKLIVFSAVTLGSFMLPITRQAVFMPLRTAKYDFSEIKAPLPEQTQYRITFTESQSNFLINGLHLFHSNISIPHSKRKVIYFMHGNNSTLEIGGIPAGNLFYSMGFDFFAIDYRGYGESSPIFPDEQSIYRDVEEGLKYLTNDLHYNSSDIVYVGHSLGAGAATELAIRNSPSRLILISPFTCVTMAVSNLTGGISDPTWSTNIYFNNEQKISSIRCPVMFIHGQNDILLTPEFSKRLYSKANYPKSLYFISNCGHADREIFPKIGIQIRRELTRFIED